MDVLIWACLSQPGNRAHLSCSCFWAQNSFLGQIVSSAPLMSRVQSYEVGRGDQHLLSTKRSPRLPEPLISLGVGLGQHVSPFGLLPQNTTDELAYKQQIFSSHSLEAASPGSGYQHNQERDLFWVTDSLLCPHTVEGARELSGISYKITDPIPEGSTLMTSSAPRGLTSKYHHTEG